MRLLSKQKGQAIPIGIASIMGVTILMLTLFNTSQVTSEKMRIVNTADAAAYSGMVVQARTLNFMSYTNRAMVANQVAIAQMVTLFSFGPYLERVGVRLAAALNTIPYLGPALANAVRTATRGLNNIIRPFAQTTAGIINGVQSGINLAQGAAREASILATPAIVSQVVRANDPNYEVTIPGNILEGRNALAWRSMISRHGNTNFYQNRKAQLALASRDRFTTSDRGWGRACIACFYFVWAYFQRDADTRLISQGNVNSRRQSNARWEWKAKDTLSLWTGIRYWGCGRWSCGWRTPEQEFPIGYAAAFTSQNNRDFDRCRGWFCRNTWGFKNRRAERWADGAKRNMRSGYQGMLSYYDLTNAAHRSAGVRRPTNTATNRLAIEVRRRLNSPVRTSSNINNLGSRNAYVANSTRNGLGDGMFRVDDNFAGNDGISAVAKAEVYFSRPIGVGRWAGFNNFGSNARDDGRDGRGRRISREEYSNLFNPYWDVRLVDATPERVFTVARRAL